MKKKVKIKLLKKRIDFLEGVIEKYFFAICDLRRSVDESSQNMVYGISRLQGTGESPIIENVPPQLKEEIMNLPLFDCGIR